MSSPTRATTSRSTAPGSPRIRTSILFWLADRIDDRGWGLEGDTFHAMDRLRARGEDVWFNLGDEDLEIGRDRLRRLQAGERLTETLEALRATLGVTRRVLPMCDEPAPTFVGGTPFQEWMIRAGGTARRGHDGPAATMTPEVADGDRRRRRGGHRPEQPGRLDRPDPRPSRACARRWRRSASSRSARSCDGKVLKGPTAASSDPGRRRRLLRRPRRRLGRRRGGPGLRDARHRCPDGRRRGAAGPRAFVKGLRRMSDLAGKTLFISGASRGIGLAIAKRAAQDGANVCIVAKTAEPHPKLEGTIYTAAEGDRGGRRAGAAGRRRRPRRGLRARRRLPVRRAVRRHRHLRQQRVARSTSPAPSSSR